MSYKLLLYITKLQEKFTDSNNTVEQDRRATYSYHVTEKTFTLKKNDYLSA